MLFGVPETEIVGAIEGFGSLRVGTVVGVETLVGVASAGFDVGSDIIGLLVDFVSLKDSGVVSELQAARISPTNTISISVFRIVKYYH